MDSTINNTKFRLPEWLEDTKRWRMRIGYHFGRTGKRVKRSFYWPSDDNNGGTPPPHIIAEAVQLQKEWRQIKADWKSVAWKLRAVFLDRDWSKPVWAKEEIAKASAGEVAGIEGAMAAFAAAEVAREHQEQQQALRWVAKNGISALISGLRTSCAAAQVPQCFPESHQIRLVEQLEAERATALRELNPVAQRIMVKPIRVCDAVTECLKQPEARVKLKTSLGISSTTADAVEERLRGVFGQSSNPLKPPIRTTPIAFDALISSVDKKMIAEFANYWHEMPEGVTSERTVKNRLEAARWFFTWCEQQAEYGWRLPPECRPLLTASNVKREAIDFDPEAINKIIAEGGDRVRVYALFGLTCGYYQSDIADTVESHFFTRSGDHFIQRLRSKENRPKRGRRPLKVRHWIAPEFAALIDAERGINPKGTLFNSIRGTAMSASAIHERWYDSYVRADSYLMFSQLRKMGYNAIKRLGGNHGPLMAEFWDGHAKGVSDAYDDGVWPEMNEVEQLWAEELRHHKVLI